MQNPHLGSKIKIKKKRLKNHSTNHLELSCAKKTLQQTPNIREMRPFLKSAIMQRLYPMQSIHFRSKFKIPKKCEYSF